MGYTLLTRSAWILAILLPLSFQSSADSLFSKRVAEAGTLISDKKVRYDVGDIITILVREQVSATTSANTNTKKESDVSAEAAAAANPFLVSNTGLNILNPGELPNWEIEAENEHRTTGQTNRSNTLTMTITCTVTDVLDNGNVRLSGHKTVTVNREQSQFFVTGIARPRDVSPANTLESNLLADAQVQLNGKGPLWNNQRRGFVTKILDWFSPF